MYSINLIIVKSKYILRLKKDLVDKRNILSCILKRFIERQKIFYGNEKNKAVAIATAFIF